MHACTYSITSYVCELYCTALLQGCIPNSGFIGQKEGEDSAPLMILEYMQYGDLHGFLVDTR